MMYSCRILLAAVAAFGVVRCRGAESEQPLPEGMEELSVRMEQAGLTPDRCYLKAKYLSGGKILVSKYPEEGFTYDWSFEGGGLSGINERSGLEDVGNVNGKLSLRVARQDAFFGWGDVSLGEEPVKLGHDPLNATYNGRRLYGFRMRVRQSLPESTWSIAIRRRYVKGHTATDVEFLDPVTINGNGWQTVLFEVPYSRRKGFLFYSGVRFITQTPGNEVEIDWVEPCVRELHPFYRKEFVLNAAARWARCSIQSGVNITVYVNGEPAVEKTGGSTRFPYALWNYQLPPDLFRIGKNTIVVETTSGTRHAYLLFDGAVLCKNGELVRVDSDHTWSAGNNITREQMLPGSDAEPWGDVKEWDVDILDYVSGRPRGNWFNPSWKGLLSVSPADGRAYPVYVSKEDVALKVSVPDRRGRSQRVSYALYDEMGDGYIAFDTLIKEGELRLTRDGLDNSAVFESEAGVLEYNKAYAFDVTLRENDEQVETYRYEFAVCGPVDQPVVMQPGDYTNGMDLALVYEIDAAAEPEPGEFVSCIQDTTKGKHDVKEAQSSVIATPLGRFRQPYRHGYVSWKFRIKDPTRPHVVIAEYPDDTTRCQTMWITAAPTESARGGGYNNNQCANDTVMLGGENPLTQTIKQHHALFFPVGKLYTASFAALGGRATSVWDPEKTARVGRIRVYEIRNDVPRVRIHDAPGSRRWLGQRLEPGPRVVMQSCLSSPLASRFRRTYILSDTPNFYRNWMITYRNLIKRMRFAGENCIGYGVYMYLSVLYPSETFRRSAFGNFYCGSFKDSMCLMARMFEENDLGVYTGLEIIGFDQLTLEHTDAEVAEGRETAAQIDKTGRQQLGMYGRLQPNWLHPESQKYLHTLFDELLELYGSYDAFKGIIMHTVLGASWGITWGATERDPYLTGYGDTTMGLLEGETGLEIPVAKTDPERFQKRYAWLMENAWDTWTGWRCDRLTGVYEDLAARMRETRDDLQLVSHFYLPAYVMGPCREELDADEALDTFVPYGIDVRALQKDEGIVFVKNVYCNDQLHYYIADRASDARAKAHDPSYTSVFANDGKSGVGMRYSWHEYQLYSPEGWPMVYSGLESWPVPGSGFFADYYANVFIRTNPSMMWFAIVDCALWNGREKDLARFAQAYRSVPNGLYERLRGNGLDRNVWVEVCRFGGDVYGYVANPQYWHMIVKLRFADGLEKTDLIDWSEIKGREWVVELGPYRIKTFRIAECDDVGVIRSADAVVGDTGRRYVQTRLDDFKDRVDRGAQALERRAKLGQARALVRLCETRMQANDWDAAAEALGTSLLWNDLLETSWVPGHDVKTAVVSRTSGPVDFAAAPSAWGGEPALTLRQTSDIRYKRKPWEWHGEADLSVNGYMLWDADHLYVGFRVQDSELKPKANSGDSVEMYLDADLYGDYGRKNYDTDDFNFKLVPPASDTAEAEVRVMQGTETGAKKPAVVTVRVDGRVLEDGYALCAAIPWAQVGVTPVPGMELGFDIVVLDFDEGKGFGTMEWSAPGAAVFSNPRVMGRIVLGDATQ